MTQYLEIGVGRNDPLLRARGRGSKTLRHALLWHASFLYCLLHMVANTMRRG